MFGRSVDGGGGGDDDSGDAGMSWLRMETEWKLFFHANANLRPDPAGRPLVPVAERWGKLAR